jgi:hypothetical protein
MFGKPMDQPLHYFIAARFKILCGLSPWILTANLLW